MRAAVGALGEALSCVGVDVFAESLTLIIEPFADVVLAAGMHKPALSGRLALHPLAFINEPVRPDLGALAVLLAPFPLTSVHLANVSDLWRVDSDVVFGCFEVISREVLAVPVVDNLEESIVVLDCPVYDNKVLYSGLAARNSTPGIFDSLSSPNSIFSCVYRNS